MDDKVQAVKDSIQSELIFIDVKPYSHNIVSCNLRWLCELTDQKTVDHYIHNNGLDKRGWLPKDKDFYDTHGITKPTKDECEIYSIRQRILGEKALGIGDHYDSDGYDTCSTVDDDDDDEHDADDWEGMDDNTLMDMMGGMGDNLHGPNWPPSKVERWMAATEHLR